MPSRRSLLGRVGAIGGLAAAGCVGRESASDSETPSPTPTDSATPTASQTPTRAESPERLTFGETNDDGVTARGVTVQSAVRHTRNVDHNGIVTGPHWYVFTTLDRERGTPVPTTYRLRTERATYRPLVARGDDYFRNQLAYVNGRAYGDHQSGWLLFVVPYDDPARNVRLERDETTWRLPAAAVDRLRADPPSFALQRVEAPTAPPADEPFDVELTVRNDGGRGVFRGAFNYTAPLYIPRGVTGSIEAGVTKTISVTVDVHTSYGGGPGESVAARVVSAGGSDDWSVTLS